ncbi:MAG: GTP cyclohydrolase I FolE [Acidobacteriota bacterium]
MPAPSKPDRRTLRRAARLFLDAIGESGLRREMRRTPERVADAWTEEILSGYRDDPARILGGAFSAPEEGMVVVADIPFVSVCVHHLLPFHGRAHVAYLPDGRLVGLSKIARAVDVLARRLQIQERLTRQVVDALESALAPAGVACRLEAEHLCMTARGARARGAAVVTAAYGGAFARSAALRAEFLRLCGAAGPAARLRRRGARRRQRPRGGAAGHAARR